MYMAGASMDPKAPPIPANSSYKNLPNAAVYKAEIDRFATAMAVADANINKQLKISTAFNALQAAENARDTAPDAYEAARVSYYTLVKGDTWLRDEHARVANVEAQPVVNDLVSKYTGLQEKRSQQQSTIDVVNGVKDRLLSVKDDLQFSVKQFEKQVGDIKNQINKDKRNQSEIIAETASWFDVLLNWLIAIATLVAIVLLARRFFRSKAPTAVDIDTQARLMRAQAYLTNANARAGPRRGWLW
jgi:hypothetical protein